MNIVISVIFTLTFVFFDKSKSCKNYYFTVLVNYYFTLVYTYYFNNIIPIN